ncbi:related to myosins, conserved, ubiquitous membrane protein required for cell viability [Phialocephala subalpina]|uniref:Related to myosins, conserved, ubiquitous membrane protein required for cell viability n=1 Tax=Phialocephala subalpina TaxID=576137 RepID=A0A1L7WFQ2_9HELO|nr:related to myosins, conserved, ubiquitous membrane protein required for cell viability [Phialocephala subalpina]
MHAIRQKCRPKHQVLILKCYPKTTKGAVDVKPNSSELSYLLYYATTRRSKVQKVGQFLEKKTASDVWRARIGNVQVTLQILAALIEKAPRDLPLYAPYVLKILSIILRSRDITMVESSVASFEAFCENHDGASLSADQEYLHQYEEIVRMYASFASTRQQPSKVPISAPVAMRWRSVGLEAIKSVASSEALASLAGRQLDVIVPILLENLWTDNEEFIELLEHRVQLEEKIDTEKLLRRRTSIATVRTADTAEANAAALSGTTADADKVAEEDIGVLAMQCLKQIFVVNNRSQIHGATLATLRFIADRVAQHEQVIDEKVRAGHWRGWATRIFEMIASWTPVQDRYVILVTTMDTLTRTEIAEDTMQQQLVLTTMIDSLLKSDINLIGLSVMDVLLGLIQQVLKLLQLDPNQSNGLGSSQDLSGNTNSGEAAMIPTHLRMELIVRLQDCIGDLATHVYYADQISDMVAAILLRLKPPTLSNVPNTVAAIENPNGATAAIASSGNLAEDPATDGFFSFDTAKIMALEAIKSILIVASNRNTMTGVGSLGRNRVPVRVWEGTQWLLRDTDGRVRKAYVDALLTWLDREMTRSDLRVFEEKSKALSKSHRNDSGTNLTKRAVSNASGKEKPVKHSRTTFLQLLHLAVYENAIQYVDYEEDIVLLHLLLTRLVENLGVNAVRNGLPMIFRLQEDILEAETPIAKIRMGSLCHGYFWVLSEKFDFDTSPIGRAIQNEIHRRQSKMFWIDRVRYPPISLDQIGTPGESLPPRTLPLKEIETEALRPFDDRYQMVTLISLSYTANLASPPTSAPTSPGRSFSHPLLTTTSTITEEGHAMPEKVKEQMMAEWSRDFVIAIAQEGSKTVSLNGSRSGTNTTGHRNFLAVNGNQNGGTNSGSQSPKHGNPDPRGRPPSSSYGLVGGLGGLQKLRKPNGQSPGPPSDSSRNSVTRVDTLKRVLSGRQGSAPATRMGAHSDASSESMVSYDFTASEVSFNPPPPNVPVVERSASMRGSNERTRSKSRDRVASAGEHSRPLSSHPVLLNDSNVPRESEEDLDAVPPVPPLPSALSGDGTSAQDYTTPNTLRKGRSVKRSDKNRPGLTYQGSSSWGDEGGPVMDLESLLKGIDTGGADQRGNVAKPPY